MTNLTNEEMLAKALADELRPWLERIRQLETRDIEKGAEIRLLRELVLSEKRTAPGRFGIPWRKGATHPFGEGRGLKLER